MVTRTCVVCRKRDEAERLLRFTAAAEDSGSPFALWISGAHSGRAAYVHPFPECLFRGGLFEAVRFSLSARRVKASRKDRRKESSSRGGNQGDSAAIEQLSKLVTSALNESAPPPGGRVSVRVGAGRALLQQVGQELEKRSAGVSADVAAPRGVPRAGMKAGKIRF